MKHSEMSALAERPCTAWDQTMSGRCGNCGYDPLRDDETARNAALTRTTDAPMLR